MIYPFCTYNSGPCFREKIERDFSVPFESQAALAALREPSAGGCGSCGSLETASDMAQLS
jgi:hypothetical protein